MKREYCDLCGRESKTSNLKMLMYFQSGHRTERNFDVCGICYSEYMNRINQAAVDFIHETKWWKDNQNDNGDIDYGKFRMVGDCEQGGYVCPKCGHSNNPYTFKNKCQSCGYENQG